MSEIKLTAKQEKFIQNVLSGMNQTQAYKDAYPNTKMSDARIATEASEMINGTGKYERFPNVSRKYKELHEKAVAEAEKGLIADAQEMQETLSKIIRQQLEEEVIVVEGHGSGFSEATTKKKKASLNDITKAIQTLAKLQGIGNEKVVADLNISPIVLKDDVTE